MTMGREVVGAVRVIGLVQGVGFRWWASREASRLGIRGYVRNRGDGSVEVAFAGLGEAVASFVDRLESGPEGARVERLEGLTVGEALPEEGFEIRRGA
jgi:acylphosphatase